MKNLALPLLLALSGLGAGIAAGVTLRTDTKPDPSSEGGADASTAKPEGEAHGDTGGKASDFVRLDNQFVVPLIENDRVSALVLLLLNLEVPKGGSDAVFAREPKLRDALLQVLFDHANSGGFREVFTGSANMMALRRALTEAAQGILGRDKVLDVLIIEVLRQDG